MIAMVAARLGNVFKFYIRWFGQRDLGPGLLNAFIQKIMPNGRNVIGVQGQITFIANGFKRRIGIDGNLRYSWCVRQFD